MRARIIFVGTLGMLLLSGCYLPNRSAPATEENYKTVLDSWLGRSRSVLLSVWGEPTYNYVQADGNYLVYVKTTVERADQGARIERMPRISTEHAFYKQPSGLVTQTCTTVFKLEKEVVVSWLFEGNNCVSSD